MPSSAINGQGSPANTASYDLQNGNYSVPVGIPSGRATAQGHHPIRVSSLGTFIAGRGAAATVSLQIGSGGTNQFTVGAAGGAATTGQVSLSFAAAFFLDGGTSTFSITQYGPCYYGWSSSSQTITEPDSSTRPGSTLVGYIAYYQAPTAPTSPSVVGGSTSATLSWGLPSDDGESAITGYRYEWSLSSTFASGVSSGNTTARSVNITGLTAGSTYYFRVAAKNNVTDQFGEWSTYTATVNATLGSAPGAPTSLVATAVPNDGAVGLTWVAPASTGGQPIIDYVVQYDTDPGFATVQTLSTGVPLNRTVSGLTPGTSYYFRVAARNSIGVGAYTAGVSATIPARTALAGIESGSLNLPGGVTVSLRGTGATPNVITLGFSALTETTAWHTIATLPMAAGAGNFSARGSLDDFAMVADSAGNIYIIGAAATDPTALAVICYKRTGATNAWVAQPMLTQALGAGELFGRFEAAYVPGTGASPKASILVLGRRYGSVGAGGLVYATVSAANALAGSGTLFIANGTDPTWLSTPPTAAAANSGTLDVQALGVGLTRLAIVANTRAVVDVVNGVVTGVSKGTNGAQDYSNAGGVRVVGISATMFALVAVATGSGSSLQVAFYGTNGTALGSATIAAAAVQGGAFARQWDAFYNLATGQLAVYYVAASSALKVERVDISPVTFNAAAAVSITTTLGPAGSTNPNIRVPHGFVDERRVLLESANVSSTGVNSMPLVDDRSNNLAPTAPTLATRANFDSTVAAAFGWTFSDGNAADVQTAFQLVVEIVSSGLSAYDSGKITGAPGASSAFTLAANALTNGVAYRWKVRTYDALDSVSAYSAYGTFSTSAIGTLTITDPAADGSTPIVNTYNVKWTYAQANAYTQAQRRVRVTRTDTGALLSDTTMQVSTVLNYTVGPLPSDVPVRVDIDIINSNAQTVPTVSRTLTPSYAAPMAPSVNLIPGSNYIEVDVLNPPPVGSRPEAVSNGIQKRLAGTTDPFITIATVGYAGTYLDRAVGSGNDYEYRAIASDS